MPRNFRSRGHYFPDSQYTHRQGPTLPAKYGDPKTSGVEIEIDTDWSDLNIDLN